MRTKTTAISPKIVCHVVFFKESPVDLQGLREGMQEFGVFLKVQGLEESETGLGCLV